MFRRSLLCAVVLCLMSFQSGLWAQGRSSGSDNAKPAMPDEWADYIKWRSIGPANMGGRITSLAVYEADPSIWYVATASGGLLKTVNNGQTFEHLFDDQSTVSIGDVQVCQSDPDIVWVGTGESNPRNSVSWGDGVYKSTDGGKTWKNTGLEETFQIGRIAIHPDDPDTVYVGALGRLWGPSEQRGLFKTTDGGENWEKILFVNDETGVIDVRMHPRDPDNLLVATYERQRDGFDGNDPGKKYGDGSGLYRTTDGGQTFEEVTAGLPTCKKGRIGLDWYRKNPKYVFAIVESEKIASVPENAGYAGLSGEDADAGARVTDVVEDSPAEKAGLEIDDIVLQVNGQFVHSYDEMLKALRQNVAGDEVKLVLSRDREQKNITIELGNRPRRRGRNGRPRSSEFTGTLGGQAANLQGQQGQENEHEYGGVYMSRDAGVTWQRINTLNPRPMYYSQIRVDPSDRNNLYVLGTSLYRSADGGETFEGDGGQGIHPDHHALWIDPENGQHMVLGNDGGIYVTWNRMDNWEHLNRMAIGQFYHVGIDAEDDYKVYGGLQDNGSWGGPMRVGTAGPTNSDWFRVGGGDGFITLVDPTDPDQVYFESQNGAMGRINFRTGERGFVRPRPPRGTRYRFNWKTPFVLSPHNPEIHYSAGNHVFRSVSKGDNVQAISPEITNSDRGAGSAISESPLAAGVLYVGTTDGAVWMTRDDGKTWEEIFVQPVAPEEEKDEEEKDEEEKDEEEDKESAEPADPSGEQGESGEASVEAADQPAADQSPPETEDADMAEEAEPAADPAAGQDGSEAAAEADQAVLDKLSGNWRGTLNVERLPEDQRWIEITIGKDDQGKLSGSFTTPRNETLLSGFRYDAESEMYRFEGTNDRLEARFECRLTEDGLRGQVDVGDTKLEFEASRVDDQADLPVVTPVVVPARLAASASRWQEDDPVSGLWKAMMQSDQIPEGQGEFELELKMDEQGEITGMVSSMMGEMEVFDGSFNAESGKLRFKISSEEAGMEADISGTIEGSSLAGKISGGGGQFQMEFVAERETAGEPVAGTDDSPQSASPPASEAPQAGKSTDPVTAADDDPVTGTWDGKFVSEFMQGDRAKFQMGLKKSADGSISGWYQTSQGSGEISEGKFDADKKTLSFLAVSERSELDFSGSLAGNKLSGDVDIVGRSFSFEFESSRTSTRYSPAGEAEEPEEAPGSGSRLGDLLPGPRWVSSLEASHHKPGRVYITLDGHRSNDDEPYVLVSENYGKTWASLRGNLPASAGSTRVVREDIENENLLFLGCEFSAWVSIDRGQTWTRFSGGLPTVAVHEFAIHPSSGEIVAGTHGRSLWVADISPLRQLDEKTLDKEVALLQPNPVIRWSSRTSRGEDGLNRFEGAAPDQNAEIFYYLGNRTQNVKLTISDLLGNEIRSFDGQDTPGLHQVVWDLRRAGQESSGGRNRFRRAASVPAGKYLVTLNAGGQQFKQLLEIKADPTSDQGSATQQQQEFDDFWFGLTDEESPDAGPRDH